MAPKTILYMWIECTEGFSVGEKAKVMEEKEGYGVGGLLCSNAFIN